MNDRDGYRFSLLVGLHGGGGRGAILVNGHEHHVEFRCELESIINSGRDGQRIC